MRSVSLQRPRPGWTARPVPPQQGSCGPARLQHAGVLLTARRRLVARCRSPRVLRLPERRTTTARSCAAPTRSFFRIAMANHFAHPASRDRPGSTGHHCAARYGGPPALAPSLFRRRAAVASASLAAAAAGGSISFPSGFIACGCAISLAAVGADSRCGRQRRCARAALGRATAIKSHIQWSYMCPCDESNYSTFMCEEVA